MASVCLFEVNFVIVPIDRVTEINDKEINQF